MIESTMNQQPLEYYDLPGILATPLRTASFTALIPIPSTVRPSSAFPLSSLPRPLLSRRLLLLLLRPAHSPPSSSEYRPVLQIFAPVADFRGRFDVGKLPNRAPFAAPSVKVLGKLARVLGWGKSMFCRFRRRILLIIGNVR